MTPEDRARKVDCIQRQFDLSPLPDAMIEFVFYYLFEHTPTTRIQLLGEEVARQAKVAVDVEGCGAERVERVDIRPETIEPGWPARGADAMGETLEVGQVVYLAKIDTQAPPGIRGFASAGEARIVGVGAAVVAVACRGEVGFWPVSLIFTDSEALDAFLKAKADSDTSEAEIQEWFQVHDPFPFRFR